MLDFLFTAAVRAVALKTLQDATAAVRGRNAVLVTALRRAGCKGHEIGLAHSTKEPAKVTLRPRSTAAN